MTELILASASPYKYKLFSQLGLKFKALHPALEEVFSDHLSGEEQAVALSLQKAKTLAATHPDALIIGADQVLECEGVCFQKPGSAENALLQLRKLVGRTHLLHTAITAIHVNGSYRRTENVISKMTMSANLADAYLREVIEKDQTWDCVGSYKIESLGITLFDKVDTPDFTAIVGLPLMMLSHILRERGFFHASVANEV